MTDLTLIIPAKKESESLPTVLKELEKFPYNIKIILEKSDIETIDSIKANDSEIIFQSKKGYGNALIEGIKSVHTKYFCVFNADGSFIPDELEGMLKKIKLENADFVFASRYEKNSKTDDDTVITSIGNFFFTRIGNIFFKLPISDILYTYVLGKVESAKKLDLKQNDFRFCVELPMKAKFNKMILLNNIAHERARIGGIKKVNAFKDGFLILIAMVKYFIKKN